VYDSVTTIILNTIPVSFLVQLYKTNFTCIKNRGTWYFSSVLFPILWLQRKSVGGLYFSFAKTTTVFHWLNIPANTVFQHRKYFRNWLFKFIIRGRKICHKYWLQIWLIDIWRFFHYLDVLKIIFLFCIMIKKPNHISCCNSSILKWHGSPHPPFTQILCITDFFLL